MNNNKLVYIDEHRVRQLLNWDTTFEAVEKSMESVATGQSFQNARAITKIPNTSNFLYTMPGFLNDSKYGALGCKLVSHVPSNPNRAEPLPYVLANILLLDAETSVLKAVIAGTDITNWRTAAASAVATKYLHGGTTSGKENNILAIIGAGVQGKIHAVAFQHYFKFKQVRIWNRTSARAQKLAEELNKEHNTKDLFVAYDKAEDCVRNADVIVTATTGAATLVKGEWVKKGAHINAVAVNPNRELDDATYQAAEVYIDNWNGARSELNGIKELGVEFKGQIGDLITGAVPPPKSDAITVFQSLGMAVEDCAMARLIYDLHHSN